MTATRPRLRRRMERLIGELKARKVLRVGAGYVVIAWVVVQVGEILFEALLLPQWSNSLLVSLMILGFPVALVMAWAFEITPSGIELDQHARHRHEAGVANPSPPPGIFHSIAVMPFEDLSAGRDLGYLCGGIAEEATLALGQLEGLHVVDLKPWLMSAKQGGPLLPDHSPGDVSLVVRGSVRRESDQYRITASLLSTRDQHVLWSRNFQRQANEIFRLEEEVARAIARVIELSMDNPEPTEHIETHPLAYESFLCGLRYFRMGKDKNPLAQRMFRRSVEIDPEFGRAWAYLACTKACEFLYFDSSDQVRLETRQLSERALELAPNLSVSRVAAGLSLCLEGRFTHADREFERAITIEPDSFDAWYFYARSQVHQGNTERALQFFDRAAAVKRDDYQCLFLKAAQLEKLGRESAAHETLRDGLDRARAYLEMHPDDWRAWNLGAIAYLRLGEENKAETWLQTSLLNAPRDSSVAYNAACFYALKGNSEKALQFLGACANVGSITREWIAQDSDLDSIRGLPEFSQLFKRFPERGSSPEAAAIDQKI